MTTRYDPRTTILADGFDSMNRSIRPQNGKTIPWSKAASGIDMPGAVPIGVTLHESNTGYMYYVVEFGHPNEN